jgi:hypothetical protein
VVLWRFIVWPVAVVNRSPVRWLVVALFRVSLGRRKAVD